MFLPATRVGYLQSNLQPYALRWYFTTGTSDFVQRSSSMLTNWNIMKRVYRVSKKSCQSVIGPSTVIGERYRVMVENLVRPAVEERQEDVAPLPTWPELQWSSYGKFSVTEYFLDIQNSLGPIWRHPSSSFWGYLKERVHVDYRQTIQQFSSLKTNSIQRFERWSQRYWELISWFLHFSQNQI